MTALSNSIGETAPESTMYQRRWVALLLLSLSLMLIVIDGTIVNIAFPSIRKTFGASFAEAEWVNSIYSLVFGAALITWGKLGDQFGRRNIFVWGTLVFLLGSLGVGLAPSIGAMVFFRAVQGMGGAMMSPSTLSIISSTFRGKERGMAFGIWGATAGASAAIGPILGGWLITYGTNIVADSWRLAFLINVPLGIVAIFGAFWAIRESRDTTAKVTIDWLGIVVASLALGLIVFGAIEGQTYGWWEAKKVFALGPITYPVLGEGVTAIPAGTLSFIPFVFLAGAIFLAIFVIYELALERRGAEPLFEFGLLRYRSFRYGLFTVMIVALGEFGVVLALSIYFQLAKGLNAFETGIRFLPFAAIVLIAAPLAGALSSKFGSKWVVTSGMIAEAVSLFWLSRIIYETTPYRQFIPPFLLYGVGIGLAIAQLANIVLSDIPSNKAGVASGANNTIRQIGAALGIAIIGAILFGGFAVEAKPLVQNMTAFQDFGQRVADNPNLSKESKILGNAIASNGDRAKEGIITGLEANEGFDGETDVIDTTLKNLPAIAKTVLRVQGLNLDDEAVVAKVRTELAPDAAILSKDIQNILGTGFSAAARQAATAATIFVSLGAVSSLFLPNNKPQHAGDVVVAAH